MEPHASMALAVDSTALIAARKLLSWLNMLDTRFCAVDATASSEREDATSCSRARVASGCVSLGTAQPRHAALLGVSTTGYTCCRVKCTHTPDTAMVTPT